MERDRTPDMTANLEALTAFARLYGYVRFFHPSDEAAAVDWDRLAFLGARRVMDMRAQDDLLAVLEDLFLPLAPTLQLWRDDDTPPAPLVVERSDPRGLITVAWQHEGYGQQQRGPTYRNLRVGRSARFPTQVDRDLTQIVQRLPADEFRGRRVRLRARVKTEIAQQRGYVCLALDVVRVPGRRPPFPGYIGLIRSAEWSEQDKTIQVDDQAVELVLGCMVTGPCRAWFDDFELEVEVDGQWLPIPIANGGFDLGSEGWEPPAEGYRHAVHGGAMCVEREHELVERLFDEHPQVGEATETLIGAGLMARVPLALYGTPEATQGSLRRPLDAISSAMDRIDLETLGDAEFPETRVAAIVIAWNILQHFYPYHDLIEATWEDVLPRTLLRALDDQGARAFQDTLQAMLVELQDGHAGSNPPFASGFARLPLSLAWAEGRIVVAHSEHPDLQPGDVVLAVDGRLIEEVVAEHRRYFSGSTQWKDDVAVSRLQVGPRDADVALTVDREDLQRTIVVRYDRDTSPEPDRGAPVRVLGDGIFVVDLGRADLDEIEFHLQAIAGAPGVIFDLRDYPRENHDILSHLLGTPISTETVFLVPRITRPDHQERVVYETSGWRMEPKAPRIRGRVAFLTGPGAISHAETVMCLVEHYRLGEIVGEATAGTNGNMIWVALPGGFTIGFTGMRVVKHDGSQHHLVGVQPTVPAKPTIRGIREGRDEVLERALEVTRDRRITS